MDRNAPCPCGSGRKFKKCHGGAVSPEAAALPHAVLANIRRADAVLQRNKRISQDILDWADRRLGPEWMNTAYDAWGLAADADLPEEEGDLFTTWAVYHFAAKAEQGPVAAQWLAAQQARHGARMDPDTVAFVQAHRTSTLGIWRVVEPEPGVGLTVRNSLAPADDDREPYVYEAEASHDLTPGFAVLAYVMEVDDVHVFGGLHDVPLEAPELDEVLAAMNVDNDAPVMRRAWRAASERYFDRLDEEFARESPHDLH